MPQLALELLQNISSCRGRVESRGGFICMQGDGIYEYR